MVRATDSDHIVSQGTLNAGQGRVDYYTIAPAPTQWAAVGVLVWNDEPDQSETTCRLLVGTGKTESSAIAELSSRFSRVYGKRHKPRQTETFEQDQTPLQRRIGKRL